MKFKREDIIKLWNVFSSIQTETTNVRTTFTIARNLNILQPEVDAIKKAVEMRGKAEEYEKKRVELCREYCSTDDDGNPIITGGVFEIREEVRKDFEKDLQELQDSMPEAMEELLEHEKSVIAFLQDDVEIELYKFDIELIPDNVFTVDGLRIIDQMGLIMEAE